MGCVELKQETMSSLRINEHETGIRLRKMNGSGCSTHAHSVQEVSALFMSW